MSPQKISSPSREVESQFSAAELQAKQPTLTKADLVELLCNDLGLNKREAKEIVEAFLELILSAIENHKNMKLSGFGNFHLRDKRQRPGRNLRTGEAISITARRVVTFCASQKLKARVEAHIRVST